MQITPRAAPHTVVALRFALSKTISVGICSYGPCEMSQSPVVGRQARHPRVSGGFWQGSFSHQRRRLIWSFAAMPCTIPDRRLNEVDAGWEPRIAKARLQLPKPCLRIATAGTVSEVGRSMWKYSMAGVPQSTTRDHSRCFFLRRQMFPGPPRGYQGRREEPCPLPRPAVDGACGWFRGGGGGVSLVRCVRAFLCPERHVFESPLI